MAVRVPAREIGADSSAEGEGTLFCINFIGLGMHLCYRSANMRPKVASLLATSPRSLSHEISLHYGTSVSQRVLSGRLHMGWRDPEDEPQAVGCHAGSTLHSTFPPHSGSSPLHACQGKTCQERLIQ
jgi:hypothetical protein